MPCRGKVLDNRQQHGPTFGQQARGRLGAEATGHQMLVDEEPHEQMGTGVVSGR